MIHFRPSLNSIRRLKNPAQSVADYHHSATDEAIIQHKIVNHVLIYWAVAACIALSLTINRAIDIGWGWRDLIQSAIVLTVLIIAVLRHQLPLWLKDCVLVGVNTIIAVVGIYTLGLMAGGIFFFPLAATIMALIYSPRTVILFSSLALLYLTFIAQAFINGTLVITPSVEQLLLSSQHWGVYIFCLGFFFIVSCSTIFSYRKIQHDLIQQVEQQRDELNHIAQHDELTGLPKTLLALDRLERACDRHLRSGKKVAVMFLDLDDFKLINDQLGHQAGDHCLKLCALRLQSQLRKIDTVARLGGDEFLIILEDLEEAAQAGKVANKLVNLLSKPFTFQNSSLTVGCSIGISIYPDHGESIEELHYYADQAMYKVKEGGKNFYAFYDADSNEKGLVSEIP